MNQVIEAIKSRRSIKKMDPDRAPTKEQIEAVIESATWAPTHHLTEPWRFVVVTRDARRRLGEAMGRALAAFPGAVTKPSPERVEAERIKPLSAPVIVGVISNPKPGENIVRQEELVAVGAALQNLLLAAHSLGLATMVRTGPHAYSKDLKDFFEMDEDETLVGLVYIGYAAGDLPLSRRKGSQDLTTWLES